jgi:erythromycin esterase
MPDNTSFANWVRNYAIVADTLDWQAPLDDLEPLRALIGDARVVALGESAHYAREFYLLRHRLLRFLAERCGFTIYALEAPFTEAHAIDAWVQGGSGTVAEVAAAGVAIELGRWREMHELLIWMRAHNRSATTPLRFAGTDVPGSGGSPLPALEAVAAYLQQYDPDALPLLEQATALTGSYHDSATFNVLNRYTTLDPAVQDALTATLSRLLLRMETMSAEWRGPRDHRHRGRLPLHQPHGQRVPGRDVPSGAVGVEGIDRPPVRRNSRKALYLASCAAGRLPEIRSTGATA